MKLCQRQLPDQHSCMMQELRNFWIEGAFCDVILKSQDAKDCEGKGHKAHRNVLSSASKALRALLGDTFAESEQIRRGEPISIPASAPVVDALLDYVYGGEPEIATTEDAMELLVLANAYNLHFLVEAIESVLLQDLDSQTALEVFHQAHMLGFDRVCSACEELIVSTFQECVKQEAFLKLTPVQLGRILKRPDLHVAREEAVFQALLTWYKADSSRRAYLGLLLQDVDYPALSAQNLERLSCFAESLGPDGQDLSRSVKEALRWHRKRDSSPQRAFEAKRRRLLHWLPHFGADVRGLRAQDGEVVATFTSRVQHFCIRKGTGYAFLESERQIVSWTPGNNQNRVVAGRGAAVNGVSDINCTALDVSPEGELVVADWNEDGNRLLGFRNGMGTLKQSLETECDGLCFSPAGVLYVFDNYGKRVQKLLPDSRFISVIDSDQLASDMRFCAGSFTVPDEDTVYITDNRQGQARILALEAGSGLKVVGHSPRGPSMCMFLRLCVKEGHIFAVDHPSTIQMYMPGCKNPVHFLDVSDFSDPADADYPGELLADLQIDQDWLYVLTSNRMWHGNVKAKVQRYPLEPWPLIMERQALPS